MITQLMIGIQKFVKGLSFILIQMQTGFSMDQKLIDQQWSNFSQNWLSTKMDNISQLRVTAKYCPSSYLTNFEKSLTIAGLSIFDPLKNQFAFESI